MKDAFTFGSSENQIPIDDMMEYYKRNMNPETMLKHNMGLYGKLFRDTARYYKYCAGLLEKFITMYGQKKNREGTYPVNGHEIYNYVARYGMSNYQIQAIMKLDGRLDFDKLKKAVNLSIEEEPVFGCRFIEDDPPYWKPLENSGLIEFCSLEEVDDIDQAVEKFIQSPLSMDCDPMVKVKLMRSGQSDILGLKINHTCCDGAGVNEYIQLLANIYTSIDQENGRFIPKPRIGGRKDQDRLFAALGVSNPDAVYIPGSDISIPMWSFPWEQSGSNTACMVIRRLPQECLDTICRYAKSKGATVNDLILTAYYRAVLEMGPPIYGLPLQIPVTVDLRRYLPDHKTQAIRNFSGSVNTALGMSKNEPFNDTLARVTKTMKDIKKGYPGLQSAIGLERIEKISFRDTLAYYQASPESKKASYCPLYYGDKCVPTLSNLGYISRSLIKFGKSTIHDAYIIPPVIRAPGFLLMACSYNSVLTLAGGYFKHTVDRKEVEKLLDKIRDELIEACKE